MALQGTLKDFGIADIFQLIGVQQKTGVLKLKDKDKSVNVSFVKGKIVASESTVREKKEHLGEMLVRANIITKQDLSKALTKQRETLQKLGDILLKSEMMTAEDLSEMIQLQISEAIYRLFKWKTGDYEFVQQNIDYEKEHVTPISAESILMDGFRMLDEWPAVRRVIKSYDIVFSKVFGAESKIDFAEEPEEEDDIEAAFEMFGEDKKKKKPKSGKLILNRNEKRMFSFVDGRRPVHEMINISRIGEFETCKALVKLKEYGVIEVVHSDKGVIKEFKNVEIIETFINIIFIFIFIFIFFMVSTITDLTDVTNISANYFFDVKPFNVLKELRNQREMEKLDNALYLYFLRNKKFPEALDSLVRDNLVTESGITDPWGNKYSYTLTDDSYVIKRTEGEKIQIDK